MLTEPPTTFQQRPKRNKKEKKAGGGEIAASSIFKGGFKHYKASKRFYLGCLIV
jgi:hypothetical protein